MPKPQKSENGNGPVQTLRHRSLKAAIWRNETDKGPMFNATVVRSYRDKESQEWHESHSFGYDDLMNVAKLMYDAHSFISGLKAREATQRSKSPSR